jgi:hypothetical protein
MAKGFKYQRGRDAIRKSSLEWKCDSPEITQVYMLGPVRPDDLVPMNNMLLKDAFSNRDFYFLQGKRDLDHCENKIVDSNYVIETMLFFLKLFLEHFSIDGNEAYESETQPNSSGQAIPISKC